MNLDETIEFFFTDPTVAVQGDKKSVLYLLRQEAQDSFIGRVMPEDEVVAFSRKEKHRIFATALVLFAGIDLLSKYYAGDNGKGGVGQRIGDFTERYFFRGHGTPQVYADVFYVGCRNPLVHSFNLHNAKFGLSLLSNPDMAKSCLWHVKRSANQYAFIIEGLFNDFVKACRAYRADLQTDAAALRANFEKMFGLHGTITTLSLVIEPVK